MSRTVAEHYRLRFDHIGTNGTNGTNGKISLRRAGRMHHPGVGATRRRALARSLPPSST